jgi:hypothetical protein
MRYPERWRERKEKLAIYKIEMYGLVHVRDTAWHTNVGADVLYVSWHVVLYIQCVQYVPSEHVYHLQYRLLALGTGDVDHLTSVLRGGEERRGGCVGG